MTFSEDLTEINFTINVWGGEAQYWTLKGQSVDDGGNI